MVTQNKASDDNPKQDRNEEYSASKIHVRGTIELDLRYYWLESKEVRGKKNKKRAAGSSVNPDPPAMVLTFEPDRRELPGKCAKTDPSSFLERNDGGAAQRWGFGIKVYKKKPDFQRWKEKKNF